MTTFLALLVIHSRTDILDGHVHDVGDWYGTYAHAASVRADNETAAESLAHLRECVRLQRRD